MNFAQEEKGYCNNNEEEDDEEVIREMNHFPFSSSSSSASSKYKDMASHHHHHHQDLWLGSQEDYKTQEPAINFDRKLEQMDLTLGPNNNNNNNEESNVGSCRVGDSSSRCIIEKEHMFDKVVTPSDVGKLNRLVIPKQHAEKYFPLDSSSNEKGLLLNFEDRNGKSWRFRYSYWNSSQSYVMTKGWSRFVKEKKLDAGDIVSFQRGVGESEKDRLFIDWRRRPNAPDPTSLAHMQLQNHFNFPQSVRWGRLYSMPQSMCVSRSYEPLHRLNYSIYPFNHHHQQQFHHHQQQQQQQQQQQHQAIGYGNVSQYYNLRTSTTGSNQVHHQIGGMQEPMVIDSVPVVHHQANKTAGKRLRLFGVNMECPPQQDDIESTTSTFFPHGGGTSNSISTSDHDSPHFSSSSSLQSRLSNNNNTQLSGMQAEYSKKGKSSLSIDFDI